MGASTPCPATSLVVAGAWERASDVAEMTIRDGYEYMQLVFRLQQKDSSDATIGEHWEAVAVAPDDSHRAIAVKSEDTEIRRWWWDAPHPEISKYLTEYGAEGWQLVSENVDGGSVPKSFRFVMARPKAPPNRW